MDDGFNSSFLKERPDFCFHVYNNEAQNFANSAILLH